MSMQTYPYVACTIQIQKYYYTIIITIIVINTNLIWIPRSSIIQ